MRQDLQACPGATYKNTVLLLGYFGSGNYKDKAFQVRSGPGMIWIFIYFLSFRKKLRKIILLCGKFKTHNTYCSKQDSFLSILTFKFCCIYFLHFLGITFSLEEGLEFLAFITARLASRIRVGRWKGKKYYEYLVNPV